LKLNFKLGFKHEFVIVKGGVCSLSSGCECQWADPPLW
jgi:hypothetical protein